VGDEPSGLTNDDSDDDADDEEETDDCLKVPRYVLVDWSLSSSLSGKILGFVLCAA
jgi:hypothetical protein